MTSIATLRAVNDHPTWVAITLALLLETSALIAAIIASTEGDRGGLSGRI